jgi:hypothetical protein
MKSYKFKIGNFNCLAIKDGTHIYQEPVGIFFPYAPKRLLTMALKRHDIDPDNWTKWCSDYIPASWWIPEPIKLTVGRIFHLNSVWTKLSPRR